MKLKPIACSLFLLIALFSPHANLTAQDGPNRGNVPDARGAVDSHADEQTDAIGQRSAVEIATTRKVQGQINSLIRSTTDTADDAIKFDIRQSLSELFTASTIRREKEIEMLERRIASLRQLNQEREKKREQLIDLKFKSIVREVMKRRADQ